MCVCFLFFFFVFCFVFFDGGGRNIPRGGKWGFGEGSGGEGEGSGGNGGGKRWLATPLSTPMAGEPEPNRQRLVEAATFLKLKKKNS